MSAQLSTDDLESSLAPDATGVACVPSLVKGQLLLPNRPAAADIRAAFDNAPPGQASAELDDVLVIRRPTVDRETLEPTGASQFLVLAVPDPSDLIEHDADAVVNDLLRLPYNEVTDYVAALGAAISAENPAMAAVMRTTKAVTSLSDTMLDVLFRVLSEMLDPVAVRDAIDRELGYDGVPGHRYLDDWVDVPSPVRHGSTTRMANVERPDVGSAVRAVPTRQLHVTAGNSLLVPMVSMVRAIATKGAAVIKSPAQSMAAATALAVAVNDVDPDHPIARHLSLAYWRGGDRAVEDTLFDVDAFDRLVVWGGPETLASVGERSVGMKSILMRPRYGVSLVGREAFADDLGHVAQRVATDILVGNQQACTSSLAIYIEADDADAFDFCELLQRALQWWDESVPHRCDARTQTAIRRLQRGALADGLWFENGEWPDLTSSVVLAPHSFDITHHPMSRCAVVRPVSSLEDALGFVHAGVSTVGVYPEERRLALRDALAGRGVSNIYPLGDTERSYAGIPHDGMRVMSELVNWVSA